jgi:ROS/MUCR transcriptional regulator protein
MDTSNNLTDLTADVVAAYVSNNAVRPDDMANLINTIHSALSNVGQPQQSATEKHEPPNVMEKGDQAGLHHLFRGRKTIQEHEAPPDNARHDPGAISREMGSSSRFSHGGTQLQRTPFRDGQKPRIRDEDGG